MTNYNFDDIINNKSLTKEQKLYAINQRTAQNEKEINKQALKDYARVGFGSLISGASFHPILNIPYVGTGIGGALYDLGQGIVEGNNAAELAKRAGRGFAVGETVGAIPYVGKVASKTKTGQAAGQAVNKLANKLVENPQVLRTTRNLKNMLATDVKDVTRSLPSGKPETLHNFIGENAFNAPKGKLMEAKQMAMYGDSNADIRNTTGWFKGVDGKWRYEIPDGTMIDNPKLTKEFDEDIGTYFTGKLSDIYDAPELYQAYPQLANRDIVIQNMPDGYGGSSWGDTISLNRKYFQKENPEFLKLKNELENTPEYTKYNSSFNIDTGNPVEDLKIMENAEKEFFNSDVGKKYHSLMWEKNYPVSRTIQGFNDNALKTITHETQHQIQALEDFARGGNGNRADYWNLAGEAEARLAGARAKLTPEQRQIYNPANESTYLTNYGYDVLPEKQIVEFRNNEPSFSKKLSDDEFDYDKAMKLSKDLENGERNPLKYKGESAIIDNIDGISKTDMDYLTHELNNNLTLKERTKKVIKKPVGDRIYKVKNKGFNEYEYVESKAIDDILNN